MTRVRVWWALVAISLICTVFSGCGGTSSQSDAPSTSAGAAASTPGGTLAQDTPRGVLGGDWGGTLTEAGSTLELQGSIVHAATADTFSGTFALDGETYQAQGRFTDGALKATLSGPSTINLEGTCAGGRFSGSYTRRYPTGRTSSGSSGLIKFLDIQNNIRLGPWLLYTQNADGTGNMTVRIGLKNEDSPSARISATDTATQQAYTRVDMPLYWVLDSQDNLNKQNFKMFGYTFRNLPSNHLFDYRVTLYDDKHTGGYSVDASFRTPPSAADIQSGKVTQQVIYSYGDNRRYYAFPQDNLGFVEQKLCKYSALTTDPMAQTCILHTGDAATLGQFISYSAADDLWYDIGWDHEWLKSSNDVSKDYVGQTATVSKETVDWRYHTWMRACMPTLMAAGNHDGKGTIGDEGFPPDYFFTFGQLMAGQYQDDDHALYLLPPAGPHPRPGRYDTYTYCVDYGGIRIIVLNCYGAYSSDDATVVCSKLKQWIDEVPTSTPVILNMHVAIYGAKGTGASDGPNYYQHKAQLRDDIESVVGYRSNVTVVAGHVHEMCRTVQKDVHYYVLGTGGAPDMEDGEDDDVMIPFTGKDKSIYTAFGWGEFTVDFSKRKIRAHLLHTDGSTIDDTTYPW